MSERIGGFRRKTRHKLRRNIKDKGKISLNQYLQTFKTGDKVYLKMNSSIHKGPYFPRFHGLAGIIRNKQGSCYHVAIKDGNKPKILIVHPSHLKRA